MNIYRKVGVRCIPTFCGTLHDALTQCGLPGGKGDDDQRDLQIGGERIKQGPLPALKKCRIDDGHIAIGIA